MILACCLASSARLSKRAAAWPCRRVAVPVLVRAGRQPVSHQRSLFERVERSVQRLLHLVILIVEHAFGGEGVPHPAPEPHEVAALYLE
jgi:hypothetical protein